MVDNEERIFDKRIIEKNIDDGIVSKTDYEEYLTKLPDVSKKTQHIPFPHDDLMPKKTNKNLSRS